MFPASLFNKKILIIFLLILTIFTINTTSASAGFLDTLKEFFFGKETVVEPLPPTPPPVTKLNTSTPPTPYSGLTTNDVNLLIEQALAKKALTVQGPQGPTGPAGPQGSFGSSGSGSNASQTQYEKQLDRIFDSISDGVGNLSSTLGEEVNTTALNVSGNATLAGLTPDVAGSLTEGVVTTVVEGGLDNDYYNDVQKFIAIGPDGFVRYVYRRGSDELHFVQCLDEDCTTQTDTLVVTDPDWPESPTLAIGSDGFARIAYINYASPGEVHYIQCTNASCSTKNDNIVDTGDSIGLESFYTVGLALTSNDLARIVYDNYDGTSAVRLAVCNDAACTAPTLTTLATSGNYMESVSIDIAPDTFARVAYVDYSVDPDELHFVQCTNTDCSTKVNTPVDTADGDYYYLDMVLGSDGFGRIVYEDGGGDGQKFAQCTNAACSTSTITVLDDTNEANMTSIEMGDDDLPRISYDTSGDSLFYVQCTTESCSTKNTKLIASTDAYPHSLTLGDDGFARIIHGGGDDADISLTRFVTEDGGVIITGSDIGSNSSKFGQIYGTTANIDQLYLDGSLFDLDSFIASQWTTSGDDIYFEGGKVGIGTSDPLASLHIRQESGVQQPKLVIGNYTVDGAGDSGSSFFTANVWYEYPGIVVNGNGSGAADIPSLSPYGSVGIVGSGGGSAGGRVNVGIYGHAYFSQMFNGNSGNNARGGYFLSRLTSAVTDFNGTLYGVMSKADSTGGTSTAGNVYGSYSEAIGETNNTVIGTYATASGGTNNYAAIFNAGSVGIGDTSPDYKLELYDASTTPTLALSDDDIAHGLTTLAETDVFSHLTSLSTTAGGVQWTTISDADAQALSIRGVMGSTNPTDATSAIKIIGAKSNGTTGMADLAALETVFQVANNDDTSAMTILGSGFVGLSMTTPSVALDVTGDIEYTGIITDVSDERLKENIADFESGLDIVNNIGVKSFNMIGSDKNETGFIAQNVKEFWPEGVSVIDPDNGYMGVSYVSFVPILTKAVQELSQALTSLKDDLISWFGDVGNGIGEFYANTFNAKEKICVDGECLTANDVRALLDLVNDGNDNEEVIPPPEPDPEPEVEVLPEEEIIPNEVVPEPEIPSEEVAPEPEVEQIPEP